MKNTCLKTALLLTMLSTGLIAGSYTYSTSTTRAAQLASVTVAKTLLKQNGPNGISLADKNLLVNEKTMKTQWALNDMALNRGQSYQALQIAFATSTPWGGYRPPTTPTWKQYYYANSASITKKK